MKEVLKIVRGNEYPINVYVEQMSYNSSNHLTASAVDVRDIGNLKVYAVRPGSVIPLAHEVESEGKYVTVTIPSSCCMKLGQWGIRLVGTLNGRKIVSAERHVFSIVRWNGQDYVPPTLVDGEGSYLVNLKFATVDNPYDEEGGGNTPTPSTSGGYIGFANFNSIDQLNLSDLTYKPYIVGTYTLENTQRGAHFVVVCSLSSSLNILFGGIEASLTQASDENNKYYYTSGGQITGTYNVEIRNS